MRLRKLLASTLVLVALVAASGGCNRALRDGVSIGVTEGLSDGISALLSDLITSFSGDDE